MPRKKKEQLSDVISTILYEVLHTILETWKERSIKQLPSFFKKISKHLVMKYVWLAVLSIVGLILICFGIIELLALYQVPRWVALMSLGSILLIIAALQFSKVKKEW